MSYYTYILRSTASNRFYYGHSAQPEQRLKSHNQGKVRSTKAYRPWELFYTEEFHTRSEAAKRELFFKSIDGYNYLREKKIIPQ
jgi:putative endonuclease